MYFLVVFFLGFLWWILWHLVVSLCFFLGKKHRLLTLEKSYKWTIRFIVLFLFFTPTYSSLATSIHRHITFPILCEEMAGYQKSNPVVPESFLGGPLELLAYEEVKFIEWEIKDNFRKKYAKRPDLYKNMPNLPLGLYRVEYLPVGSVSCELYKQAYPNSEVRHEKGTSLRIFEFRTKQLDGLCLGITKINELQSKYKFNFFISFPKEISRFGYEVSKIEHQAINRLTNEKLSIYVHLRTSWKRADDFMFEYASPHSLSCQEKGPTRNEIFKKFFIINEKKGNN